MANSTGEMPFLDHLEELRKRILLAMVAVMAGFGIAYWMTTRYHLIEVMEAPVMPFVSGGKLAVTTLTGPFMITLKFAFILGAVFASPFIFYQLWLFLSPALTTREKKAIIPSLGIGFVLFAAGAAIGWFYVVPPGVEWLATYQSGAFNNLFTVESYMSLVVHLLVGMGIAAELPLVMILLTSLGITSSRMYSKIRRYAVLASFVGGAILAPTPEVTMMILFTIPLLLLYEVGVAGAWLIEKRRARAARIAASVLLVVLCFAPRGLHAQVPVPPAAQKPPGALDTTARKVSGQGVQVLDTNKAKRLGIPSAPLHVFGTPDSIMQALLAREGFAATRFGGDSVRYIITDQTILLGGHAATLRDGEQLEADQITYDNPNCQVLATGEPKLFQKGQAPTIAREMRVGICAGAERGVLDEAFTSMANGGANWFIRGNLAVDSSGKRLYGANTEFTSCDLPVPDYHFVAGQIKWVAQSVIVARPAVLYIRDVPVAWLPFIFQDTKRDRSSGILIPRFGFNDIVRTNRNYNRTVSNIGYYWAPNDYIDVTTALDWYSNRYTMVTGQLNYRWLDRFVAGSLRLSRQMESGGSASNVLHWDHRQSFDVTTSLTFNLNYQSDSRVQANNAIDLYASTAQISSQLNLMKKLSFGTLSVGGSRNEALRTGVGSMTFPQLSFSPTPISLGPNVLWSPQLTATNTTNFNQNQPLGNPQLLTPTGVDSVVTKASNRTSSIDLTTPFTIHGWTLPLSIQYHDEQLFARTAVNDSVIDPATGLTLPRTTYRAGTYKSGFNIETGISLPVIAHGTWNVTPTVGFTNIVSSERLFIRSPASNGAWIAQGKKLAFGLDMHPVFFAFSNGGLGPFSKMRYTFEPSMTLRYSPAASVSAEFAKAAASSFGQITPDVPASASMLVSLRQTLEGKRRAPPGDTNTDPTRLPKTRVLSISTTALSYDFEQAKLAHRTGWQTSTVQNTFQSDLLPNFTLATTHSLWDGQVGTDSAKFSPFLSQATASLQLTGAFFKSIGRFLHLGSRDSVPGRAPGTPTPGAVTPGSPVQPFAGAGSRFAPAPVAARGFNMSLSYSLQRYRTGTPTALPVPTETPGQGTNDPFNTGSIIPVLAQPAQSQVSINLAFAPTAFWSMTWNTMYDITAGRFQQHQIVLQRDLHDWRASFSFTKNTNGNFALFFTVFLVNLPDIKFDYNQQTLQQATVRQ